MRVEINEMKKSTVGLLALMIVVSLIGCDLVGSSKNKKSVIARLDLSNAQSLAIATSDSHSSSSVSARSSSDNSILLKLDENGNVEPVAHYDKNGNSVRAPNALEIRNINEDWIALFYADHGTIDGTGEANHVYVIQKSTGNAYRLPKHMMVQRCFDGFSKAANGYLYFRVRDRNNWDVPIQIYRVQPGTNPTATRISLTVDTVAGDYWPGHDWFTASFAVGDDGTVIYNSDATNDNWGDQRTRVVFPGGSSYTLASTQSLFWQGLDGHVYWYGRVDGDDTNRIFRPYLEGSSLQNGLYATPTGSPNSSMAVISTATRVIAIENNSGYIVEVYRQNLNEGDTLRSTSIADWSTIRDTAWAGEQIVFLVNGELIPFDPEEFETGATIIPSEGYEFYTIQPYSDIEVFFSGLRNLDSAVITGRININTGAISVSSAESSYEVVQLERIH